MGWKLYERITPLPYCVYILLSLKDDNFYVGYTTDLSRRLEEHNQGRNTSTAPRRPFVLVHAEAYLAEADAEQREELPEDRQRTAHVAADAHGESQTGKGAA